LAWLPPNADHLAALAANPGGLQRTFNASDHFGDVADPDRRSVAEDHYGFRDSLRREQLPIGADLIGLLWSLQRANRKLGGIADHRRCDLVETYPARRQRQRVHHDGRRELLLAEDRYLTDTRQR
jgi:hypothetical protein